MPLLCWHFVSMNRVKLKYQNDSVEIMQCTTKYITRCSTTILVLPLVLLFLPTLISSLSRRDCLPTLTGTFDNHIIGICMIYFCADERTLLFKGCCMLPWGLFIIPITIFANEYISIFLYHKNTHRSQYSVNCKIGSIVISI